MAPSAAESHPLNDIFHHNDAAAAKRSSDASTHYKQDVDPDSRTFDSSKQAWHLFRARCGQLIFTIILVVLLTIVLIVYQNRGIVTHYDRNWFNVAITVLSLALGLNFFEAFKDIAKVARWRIIAHGKYTVREVDLIMGAESLMKLVRLMWESRRKGRIFAVCGIWLLVNIAAQAAVAILTLTFSLDQGSDSSGTYTTQGPVTVPKLDCYYDPFNRNPEEVACPDHNPKTPETAMTYASIYGQSIITEKLCNYSSPADLLSPTADQSCYFYLNDEPSHIYESIYTYQFRQYNPNDTSQSYPLLTSRFITASSGPCIQYSAAPYPNNNPFINSTDGPESVLQVGFHNDSYSDRLLIPRELTGFDSTSYVWNDTAAPQNTTSHVCGPRCLWVYAYRAPGPLSKRDPTVFQCPITISPVLDFSSFSTSSDEEDDPSNQDPQDSILNSPPASDPKFLIPDNVARLAASSITLSGRYENSTPPDPKTTWMQATYYTWGSYWDLEGLSKQEVGGQMALFALGSLAKMAEANPSVVIEDLQPNLGWGLEVLWGYYGALVGVIVVLHALALGLTVVSARGVVVGDDSFLGVGRLVGEIVFREDENEGGDGGNGGRDEHGWGRDGRNDRDGWVREGSGDRERKEEGPWRRGGLLSGRELAKRVEERSGVGKVAYWAERNEQGVLEVRFGRKKGGEEDGGYERRGWRRGPMFPNGLYM